MDLNPFIEDFMQISGIISIGIANINTCDDVVISKENLEEFRKIIKDLCQTIPEKVLDLDINSFRFKGNVHSIIGFVEQDTIIIFIALNNTNLTILKSKVDRFLNELLINI